MQKIIVLIEGRRESAPWNGRLLQSARTGVSSCHSAGQATTGHSTRQDTGLRQAAGRRGEG
ncbi:MAG: hypothetical protein ACQES1_01530 [Bacteroidota bacterium]